MRAVCSRLGRRAAVLTPFGALASMAFAQTLPPGKPTLPPTVLEPAPCAYGVRLPWAMTGTLVTPDTVMEKGIVRIYNRRISNVGGAKSKLGRVCAIKTGGIILPGFIDLHNHLSWNVLPRWIPTQKFNNHTEWQTDPGYQALSQLRDKLGIANLDCTANLYAEVKALAGGATSSIGSRFFPGQLRFRPLCLDGLVRNLDYRSALFGVPKPSFLCALGKKQSPLTIRDAAVNMVDVFGPNAPSAQTLDHLRCNLTKHRLRSLMVHLAEGKPDDPEAQGEFAKFEKLKLLMPGLAIVHGTALSTADFDAMKAAGAGLVWSPRSNMELYGETTNIVTARRHGLDIAIAPDWSLTGSSGILQELAYTRANFSEVSAQELTLMATSAPARIARLEDKIGRLAAGLYADLLVLADRKRESPYESIVTAGPADVLLAVVGGRAVYGDTALMQQLHPAGTLQQISVCGTDKSLDLTGTVAASKSWADVLSTLQAQVGELGPIECGVTP
jgi:hypothetical protein